jgi:hypothetical protein
VRLFSKVLIGLSLMALPALCGTFNISSANGANDWYGIQWASQGGVISGIVPGTAYVSTNGTTILASSPDIFNLTTNWTFNFGSTVTLIIADMFTDGDRFQFFLDGSLVGTPTSVPVSDSTFCGNDPVVCMANVKFSSGAFVLAAGAHSITMSNLLVNNQFASGLAAFRLDSGGVPTGGAPEPTTLGLMGLGLGGLLLRWRAKRS